MMQCTYKITGAIGNGVDIGFAVDGILSDCLVADREAQCMLAISKATYNVGALTKATALSIVACSGGGGPAEGCASEIGDSVKWLGGAAEEFAEGAIACAVSPSTVFTQRACRKKIENGGDMVGKAGKGMMKAGKICSIPAAFSYEETDEEIA